MHHTKIITDINPIYDNTHSTCSLAGLFTMVGVTLKNRAFFTDQNIYFDVNRECIQETPLQKTSFT